jgi:predicted amidophosphoribosyltransferase
MTASTPCSYCGANLPVGRTVLFCPHCGQNVGVVHCPTCGSELDVGWTFCIACGQKVTGLG